MSPSPTALPVCLVCSVDTNRDDLRSPNSLLPRLLGSEADKVDDAGKWSMDNKYYTAKVHIKVGNKN